MLSGLVHENNMKATEDRVQQLLSAARDCAANAFSHFSHLRLGVTVLTTEDKIYQGCTFDSAAFPCSICAAHVAVAQAATKGRALVVECAVVEIREEKQPEQDALPLKGCCLEWLCQYAHRDELYIHYAVAREKNGKSVCTITDNVKTYKLSELLPMGERLPAPLALQCPSLSIEKVDIDAETEADEVSVDLLKAALKAAEGSCCWRSGVSVGCAILTEDGIVTGANAETTPVGIGCCAEQSAIGYAAALGRKQFLKAAVVCASMPSEACHPCGRCLQLLMQAQERTRAAYRAADGKQQFKALAAERHLPQLMILMPWQRPAEGEGRWHLKIKPVDQLGAEDRFML